MADAKNKEGAEKAPSSKKVKVKALVNLAGTYKLAWSAGQDFEIDEKQAKELVEDKAVELVKK
jgi:hypothetical protein